MGSDAVSIVSQWRESFVFSFSVSDDISKSRYQAYLEISSGCSLVRLGNRTRVGVAWDLRRRDVTTLDFAGHQHRRIPHGTHTRPIHTTPCTMRTALLWGRQCSRQSFPRLTSRTLNRPYVNPASIRSRFATPKFRGKTILWSGAATGAAGGTLLSSLSFVEVASNKASNGEQTHEEAMLEASRKELDEQVPHALRNSAKYRRGIYFFFEDYIIEPIATGLRFLHLVIIFVPVIVTIPALWLGSRQPDRDNERSGTLWWYGFLVGSMERAGAAFIKVCCHVSYHSTHGEN